MTTLPSQVNFARHRKKRRLYGTIRKKYFSISHPSFGPVLPGLKAYAPGNKNAIPAAFDFSD